MLSLHFVKLSAPVSEAYVVLFQQYVHRYIFLPLSFSYIHNKISGSLTNVMDLSIKVMFFLREVL